MVHVLVLAAQQSRAWLPPIERRRQIPTRRLHAIGRHTQDRIRVGPRLARQCPDAVREVLRSAPRSSPPQRQWLDSIDLGAKPPDLQEKGTSRSDATNPNLDCAFSPRPRADRRRQPRIFARLWRHPGPRSHARTGQPVRWPAGIFASRVPGRQDTLHLHTHPSPSRGRALRPPLRFAPARPVRPPLPRPSRPRS